MWGQPKNWPRIYFTIRRFRRIVQQLNSRQDFYVALPKYSISSKHPTYNSWCHAIDRCTNPNSARYADYGGRGIRVCRRWLNSFQNFVDDMGKKPEGLTLDRKNVNGHYTPRNCRWADLITQANNERPNKNSLKTKCWRGHPLVRRNLETYALARGMRKCMECKRMRDRMAYRANQSPEAILAVQ
jgi:hypothetical protein